MLRNLLALNMDGVRSEYEALERQLTGLRTSIYARHECPHCHGEFTFRNGVVSIPEDSTAAEQEMAALELKKDSAHDRHNKQGRLPSR